MSADLDLDDVAATSPLAKRELDELRQRVAELENRTLPADIEEALELAKHYRDPRGNPLRDCVILARALLKACGRGE